MTNDELLDALDRTFVVDSEAYLYFNRRSAVHARMTAQTPITADALWKCAWNGGSALLRSTLTYAMCEEIAAALAATGSEK